MFKFHEAFCLFSKFPILNLTLLDWACESYSEVGRGWADLVRLKIWFDVETQTLIFFAKNKDVGRECISCVVNWEEIIKLFLLQMEMNLVPLAVKINKSASLFLSNLFWQYLNRIYNTSNQYKHKFYKGRPPKKWVKSGTYFLTYPHYQNRDISKKIVLSKFTFNYYT